MEITTFDLILKTAGWISAVAGALIVLWRYLLNPLLTVMRSLRKHSEQISAALPLLAELLEKWPSVSGRESFFYYLADLDKTVRHNDACIHALLTRMGIDDTTQRPPPRSILLTEQVGEKIHLTLDCAHVFALPDTP